MSQSASHMISPLPLSKLYTSFLQLSLFSCFSLQLQLIYTSAFTLPYKRPTRSWLVLLLVLLEVRAPCMSETLFP